MCGIGGYWGDVVTQAGSETLTALDRALHHRGPDEGGRYMEPGVGLMIRRLRIIDLVTGTQPIASEDGNVVTVFNGEIYNHSELRNGLVARGHTFRSRADTEVIVHLYEEEGIDFLHRLRGMFAIALWDRRQRRLFLARDRLGIKPLHYAATESRLIFASEIGALLAAGVADDIDLDALGAYFRIGYVPSPATCFQAIRSLPPGSCLTIDERGRRQTRWWKLTPGKQEVPASLAEAQEKLRLLVRESVRLRLISDVPLGAFLSGGLDSSLVVGTMAQEMNRPVETFTIGFESPEFDESHHSGQVARSFATNEHVEVAHPGSEAMLADIVSAFGQPFADPSAIPTLLVSRLARKHVIVALSGDGGDELFGGYTRYGVARSQRWYDSVPMPLRAAVAGAWPRSAKGAGMLRIAAHSFPGRYLENNALTTPAERRLLLEPELAGAAAENPFRLGEAIVHESSRNLGKLDDLLLFDLHSYLPDDILAKVDRMSMSCSLEARVPLLDHELVEYAFSLPLGWRMGENGSKQILRDTFASLYPASVGERGKMGFGVPLNAWLRGPLREAVRRLPASECVVHGPFRQKGVQQMVEAQLSGRSDCGRKLWALMVFESWWSSQLSAKRGHAKHERRP